MEHGAIFPCLLYREKLDISDEYNKQMSDEIFRIIGTESKTTFWEPGCIHCNPVFSEFRTKIEEAVERYARLVGTDRKFKIHSMWATVGYHGDYHGTHTHGIHPISGVYYVNIPHHPDGYFLKFISDKWTLLGNEWNEPLETKKLLLFEGWVLHGFAPNPSSEPKIAISFNLE